MFNTTETVLKYLNCLLRGIKFFSQICTLYLLKNCNMNIKLTRATHFALNSGTYVPLYLQLHAARSKDQDVASCVILFASMQIFSGEVCSVTYSNCLHL